MTTSNHGAARDAVGELARLESRKLVGSPAFLAGVGIALLGTTMFLHAARDRFASWSEDAWTMAAGFMILAILCMIATNRAALRDHREHTDEQHSSLPLQPRGRTEALVRALALPTALVTGLLAGGIALGSAFVGISGLEVLHAAQLPLLVLMLGALGVAIARWLPNPFVAPVVAFALYVVTPAESPEAWHVIWPFATPESRGMAAWHLVYVIGLAAVFAAAAVGRHGWRRSTLALLVAATTAVGVSVAAMIAGICSTSGACRF